MNTFVEILKEDHDKVKQLFKDYQGGKTKVLPQIEAELRVHMELEEKFLYPELERHEETKEKSFEAVEEHHAAKLWIKEIGKATTSDERMKARVKVLQEMIEHHIEEEEKKVFPTAKKVLDKAKVEEIAQKIQQGKSKAKSKAA